MVRAPQHLALAERAARESIILLKNEGNALPLSQRRSRRIAVIGPMADNADAWRSRYGAAAIGFRDSARRIAQEAWLADGGRF